MKPSAESRKKHSPSNAHRTYPGCRLARSFSAFGLFHAGQGVGAILGTAVVGFLLGVIFLGRGSLLLPILLHALNNLRVVAMAYLASG